MTTLVILAIAISATLVVAAVVHTRGSRDNKEPIQLGVGRKLHS